MISTDFIFVLLFLKSNKALSLYLNDLSFDGTYRLRGIRRVRDKRGQYDLNDVSLLS